jgi:purine-nucleoside phosphorylase
MAGQGQGVFERAQGIAQALAPYVAQGAPLLGVVLGSGLGAFVSSLTEDVTRIPFAEIEGFPKTTVDGHAGNLVFARLGGVPIVVMQGRVHYYEVGSMIEATLPIRALGLLGIKALMLTNSAGAINPAFQVGDLMLIEDQINMMGSNPLIGHDDARFGGKRFPDMTQAYDLELSAQVVGAASSLGIGLKRGVYCGLSGPAYETPAEIRMLRTGGADAVGMSTVPEVIVARHMGIRCVGVSCLSNLAAGLSAQPLSHDEVKETGARVEKRFVSLLGEGLKRMLPLLQTQEAKGGAR